MLADMQQWKSILKWSTSTTLIYFNQFYCRCWPHRDFDVSSIIDHLHTPSYIIILLFFILFFCFRVNAQPILNERYIIEEATSSIFSSVIATDSCYYVTGGHTDGGGFTGLKAHFIQFNDPIIFNDLVLGTSNKLKAATFHLSNQKLWFNTNNDLFILGQTILLKDQIETFQSVSKNSNLLLCSKMKAAVLEIFHCCRQRIWWRHGSCCPFLT